MKLAIVGHGYYAMGTQSGDGGTIVAGCLRWLVRHPEERLEISFICKDLASRGDAVRKIEWLWNRVDGWEMALRLKMTADVDAEILHTSFDAAIIAAPEFSHMHYAEKLAQMTSRMLFVKPFGVSQQEVLRSLAIESANNVQIFVELHKRFDLANRQFIRAARANWDSRVWFSFRYGQPASVARDTFRKWAHLSNPFQYLAPHYLDVIFASQNSGYISPDELSIEGHVATLPAPWDENIVGLVDVALRLSFSAQTVLINGTCNWIEPNSLPYPSRQEIEFQSGGAHLISQQALRGQDFYLRSRHESPNPQFHIEDEQSFASGYGPVSIEYFLDYAAGGPGVELVPLRSYLPTAQVLDFVNREIASL